MSLGDLFGAGKSTDDLKNWQSPFVNPDQLNASLNALGDTKKNLAGFTGGGITGGFDANGNAFVSADPTRSNLVTGLSNVFGEQLMKLNGLAGQIAPGFSDMRTAALADLENQQKSAVSNLRQNLENRRVLGSSFAQDAITRANASFAGQRAATSSDIYMKELAATNDLIKQQAEAGANQVQTHLTQMNLEAGMAGALAQQATSVMSAASQLKAQLLASLAGGAQSQIGANMREAANLDEKASAGFGEMLGTLLGPIATAVTGPVGGAITSALTGALKA